MKVELLVSIFSVCVALTFSYANYKRVVIQDAKKQQSDIALLVGNAMDSLDKKLGEIKTDVKDIKADLKQSQLDVATMKQQIVTLFKKYDELKERIDKFGE